MTETERLREAVNYLTARINRADNATSDVMAERDALRAENERLRDEIDNWESWSNNLARHVPQSYDDDVAQEAIILRYVADTTAALDRVRAVAREFGVEAAGSEGAWSLAFRAAQGQVERALDTPEGEK